MGTITLQGKAVNTSGNIPEAGKKAPDFVLINTDLSEISLNDYTGKKVILNIFPSIDTPVCATSVRKFNDDAGSKDNVVVFCISADLPFAHARFCGAEGLKNVISLSTYRNPSFGTDYGVTITSGVLTGLLSRAVIVIGADGNIAYSEQVPDISQEPDYTAALNAL